MSKYENERYFIDLDAPVVAVTNEQFEEYWASLEAVDRFGNGKLAETGREAIWNYEGRYWVEVQ